MKRIYFVGLLPAILGFVLLFAWRYFNFWGLETYRPPALFAPLLFILGGIFSLAAPIFYRTLFAHKMRRQKSTPLAVWLKFERNLILIALVTPYLALAAHLLSLPRFYLAGTILMGLYAIYYFYPSQKRMAFEKQIFRVK